MEQGKKEEQGRNTRWSMIAMESVVNYILKSKALRI